ncbi:MAG: hypothetical protein M3354_07780, partial [Chloroflexota bacterium]|nr:hypothetical protein [Chloroflexota bacterium]
MLSAAAKLSGGHFPFDLPGLNESRGWMYELRNLEAGLDQDGNYIGGAPWHTILLCNTKNLSDWTLSGARADAAQEIHNYVSAHLMGINPPETISDQGTFERHSYLHYHDSVTAFRAVLETNPVEYLLQEFLTEHPEMLDLGVARVTPKYQLGKEWSTDFVLELGAQEYVFVEIEAAHHPIMTGERNPKKRKGAKGLNMA